MPSPFKRILKPDIVEVFLTEAVPAAALFGADMEIDQALAGAYHEFSDLGAAIPALSAFNQ